MHSHIVPHARMQASFSCLAPLALIALSQGGWRYMLCLWLNPEHADLLNPEPNTSSNCSREDGGACPPCTAVAKPWMPNHPEP